MEAKAAKKNSPIAGISVVVIIAVLIIGGFYFLNNKAEKRMESPTTVSAVQKILLTDLSTNYPKTPKEVVRLYSEMTKCFYSEECTDAQLEKLAAMSRELFDDELRANQSDEEYFRALRNEIVAYRKADKVVSSYSVAASADVEFYSYKGFEWAQLVAIYSIRTGAKIEPSKERFLLRKDSSNHWKIYGFKLEPLDNFAIENQ